MPKKAYNRKPIKGQTPLAVSAGEGDKVIVFMRDDFNKAIQHIAKNMTWGKLAEETNIKRTTLWRIVTNKRDLTMDEFMALCDCLWLRPSDFFTRIIL